MGFAPGTDVMIFKIFSPKNSATKLALLTQNKAKICKLLIITLVFEKNANFPPENCQKIAENHNIDPRLDFFLHFYVYFFMRRYVLNHYICPGFILNETSVTARPSPPSSDRAEIVRGKVRP
jgi:hypothetical protein